MVRVGVILDPPRDVHSWLAQATAFDAAGADALIVDVPADFAELAVQAPQASLDLTALVAALAAVTARSTIVVALPEGPARDTVAALSRGRLSDPADGWEPVAMPEGRADWAALRADAAERGVTGLLLPPDPRLLDLLRNPDDHGDRSDLRLSVG